MTEEKTKISLKYLAEIKALKDVHSLLTAHNWAKLNSYTEEISALSLTGTDYGKPNATELQTRLAQDNRAMFNKLREIIDVRVKEVEAEFAAL